MLVKLTSNTSGEVILFAKDARRLFEISGKACTARGVFTLEQLSGAMAKLRQAVAAEKDGARDTAVPPAGMAREKAEDDGSGEPEPAISLAQRAHPLIRLMEMTQNDGGFILWEAAGDF